jgi:PHD/YefM family antitoxin component YafN of YafNO toxin-antitoxin module
MQMTTMTTTEAARSIGRTCLKAQHAPIELTSRGEVVAVLVGVAEWQRLTDPYAWDQKLTAEMRKRGWFGPAEEPAEVKP